MFDDRLDWKKPENPWLKDSKESRRKRRIKTIWKIEKDKNRKVTSAFDEKVKMQKKILENQGKNKWK